MRDLIRIEDPADMRLDLYRDMRDRDLAGREGVFVAEGRVVLRTLVETGRFDIVSVLGLENRVDGMAALTAKIPQDVPIYVVDAPTMTAVAGFDVHRGILAIGRRRPAEGARALLQRLETPALAIGLVGLSNHDNVGAVFRNAAAFGAGAVLLDDRCCDPLYRKAIRVSVGTSLSVPFARTESAEALCDALEDAGFVPHALTPAAPGEIGNVAAAPRTALILGTEGEGLPDSVIRRCQPLRIGMVPGFDSLNVATAGAIALHHFSRRAGLIS